MSNHLPCTINKCRNILEQFLRFVYLGSIHSFLVIHFRLIKEFDRELKDEEGRNTPEVNKQLNDEKQSMVSSWNLLFLFLVLMT